MVYGMRIAGSAMERMRSTWFMANHNFETVTVNPHVVPGISAWKRIGEFGSFTVEGPPRPESKPFNPIMKNTRMDTKNKGHRISFHSIRAIKNWVSESKKSGTRMR